MFTVLIASVAVLTAFQPAARADSLTFNNTGGASLGLVGVGGVYVYPYYLTDNTTGKVLQLWCNDAFDDVNGGDTWNVQILHGWDSGFLSAMQGTDFWADVKENYGSTGWHNGALQDSAIQQFFDADAWLKLQALPPNAPYSAAVYQVAIWELFDPSIKASDGTIQGDVNTLLGNALIPANSAGDYVHLTVYDALNCTGSDSPCILSGPDPGKEPQDFESVPDGGATLMLLGGALVGLGALRRRFRA